MDLNIMTDSLGMLALYLLLVQIQMADLNFEDDEHQKKYIKLILVGTDDDYKGQSGVGKSNIISRYVENKFDLSCNTTIGLQFSEKHVEINKKHMILQIWDTAGQERFRALNKTFYNNSLGALVIFDLANRDTFERLDRWVAQLRQNLAQTAVLLLLGNKCDIKEQQVSVKEAFDFAKKQGMGYLETSAALGTNIREAFQLLTRKIIERVNQINQFQMKTIKQKPMKIVPKKNDITLEKQEKSKKRKCCN